MKWERTLHCGCEDIKLKRFRGRPDDASPKSLIRRFLFGAEKPFDRHDWTIDRCGEEVTYVIDFYRGNVKDNGIFLDVRPALNSVNNFFDRILMSMATRSWR